MAVEKAAFYFSYLLKYFMLLLLCLVPYFGAIFPYSFAIKYLNFKRESYAVLAPKKLVKSIYTVPFVAQVGLIICQR